ncbi:hypothetical protein Taro_034954 [Colocasia esculenta]|uniref:Uncharacterized protein n=1 Tax=Colocasia esculenta TaxID=4460 RepID=A0A843WH35_COLES|nr:hypothetical protein [Colocasia esculenta]
MGDGTTFGAPGEGSRVRVVTVGIRARVYCGSCARCSWLRLLLRRVRGECDHSVFVPWWRGLWWTRWQWSSVWRTLAGKSRCSAPSRLRRICVCVPLRQRESTCWVAFSGAGLLPVEPMEGVFALLAARLLLGCSWSSSLLVLAEVRFPHNCAVNVSSCYCVDLYVEVHRLVTLCSGEVSQNRCCCSGEGFSQDYSALVSTVAVVLPQGSRMLLLLVWRVHSGGFSQNGALVVLVEVLPRSALCLFRATVVLPLWFEVCRLVGLRSGEVLPE